MQEKPGPGPSEATERFRATVEPYREKRAEEKRRAYLGAAEKEQVVFADKEGEERVTKSMFEKLVREAEMDLAIEAGREASLEALLRMPLSEILDALESGDPKMRQLAVSAELIEDAKKDLKKLGTKFKEKAAKEAKEDEKLVAEWEAEVTSGAIEAMEQEARKKLHAGGGTPQEGLVHEDVSSWAKALLKNPIALKGFVVACEARMAAIMKREGMYDFSENLSAETEGKMSKIEARLPEIFEGSEEDPEGPEKVREHLRKLAKVGEKGDFRFDFVQLKDLHGLEVDMGVMNATAGSLNTIGGMLAFVAKEGVPGRSKRERLASLDQLRDDKALLQSLIAEAYAQESQAKAMYLYAEAQAGPGVPPEEPRFKYRSDVPKPTWRSDLVDPLDLIEIIEPERDPKEIIGERIKLMDRYRRKGWEGGESWEEHRQSRREKGGEV